MQNSSHGRSIAAASVLTYRSQRYLPRWFSTATVRRMGADATVTPSARRFASRPRIDDTTIQALVALTVGAALLRFLTLSTQSYWYDEAITVELVRRPFNGMLGAFPSYRRIPGDAHPTAPHRGADRSARRPLHVDGTRRAVGRAPHAGLRGCRDRASSRAGTCQRYRPGRPRGLLHLSQRDRCDGTSDDRRRHSCRNASRRQARSGGCRGRLRSTDGGVG